jgi:hypothetical protein
LATAYAEELPTWPQYGGAKRDFVCPGRLPAGERD